MKEQVEIVNTYQHWMWICEGMNPFSSKRSTTKQKNGHLPPHLRVMVQNMKRGGVAGLLHHLVFEHSNTK